MNKKVIYLGGAMVLFYMYQKNQSPKCITKLYLVGEKKVCDIDLADQNYYTWKRAGGEELSGYYNISDFINPSNLPPNEFKMAIIGLMYDTVNDTSNNQVAQNYLTTYLKQGVTPLLQVA